MDESDASGEKDDDALVFEVGDMLAAVSLAEYPIPGGRGPRANAENNYIVGRDAVKIGQRAPRPPDGGGAGAKRKICWKRADCSPRWWPPAAARSMPPVSIPAAWCLNPDSMRAFADMIEERTSCPSSTGIWFGLWQNEKGLNGYTYGMDGLRQRRDGGAGHQMPSRAICGTFWPSFASYVLENDVELHDRETHWFCGR